MHRSYSATIPLLLSLSNAATLVLLTPILIDNALATLTLIRVPLLAIATSIALPKPLTEQTAIKLAR